MAINLTKETKEFMTAFNSHDVEKILALYSPDAIYEDIPYNRVNKGITEIRKYLNEFFKSFPDVKLEFTSDFRSGDMAANEWVMTGTNKGNIAAAPNSSEIPATGKKITVRGATFLQFRNNKVIREADYYDNATIMVQLGLMPSGPEKK